MSQLAPLINHALPYLKRLSNEEGKLLVSVARTGAELDRDADAEEWLVGLVGTHPLLLHAACFAWYRFVGDRKLLELTRSERVQAEEGIEAELALQWRYVMRTLSVSAGALVS